MLWDTSPEKVTQLTCKRQQKNSHRITKVWGNSHWSKGGRGCVSIRKSRAIFAMFVEKCQHGSKLCTDRLLPTPESWPGSSMWNVKTGSFSAVLCHCKLSNVVDLTNKPFLLRSFDQQRIGVGSNIDNAINGHASVIDMLVSIMSILIEEIQLSEQSTLPVWLPDAASLWFHVLALMYRWMTIRGRSRISTCEHKYLDLLSWILSTKLTNRNSWWDSREPLEQQVW